MNLRRAALAAALVALGAGSASAKTHLVVPYPFESVWPASLRFLKIDRGWKITEQDREAGFLRFDLVDERKVHAATLELIRVTDPEGHDAVRLQLTTADLARFQEAPILNALGRKLRDELGEPAPAKRPRPGERDRDRPRPPDAGPD